MTILKAAGAFLMLAALAMPAAAQECRNPQSPRNINPQASPSPYNGRSSQERVGLNPSNPEVILYRSPSAGLVTLQRCGQHYHSSIENPQGCPGELSAPWVEIHTVYAAQVRRDNCDPESLDCCESGPIVVRAFAARVTAGGTGGPISLPTGLPIAEWSGSSTGVHPSAECKPPAYWSFRLSCDFTVSQAQLRQFEEAHLPRPPQPTNLLSRDLTLVLP